MEENKTNNILTGQSLFDAIETIHVNYEIPVISVGSHSPAYHFPNLPEPLARYGRTGSKPVCFWPQFDWHVLFARSMGKASEKLGFVCVRPDERAIEPVGYRLEDNLLMVHFPSLMIQRFEGANCIEKSDSLYSFLNNACKLSPVFTFIVMAPGSRFGRKILSAVNDVVHPGLLFAHALGDVPRIYSKPMLVQLVRRPNLKDKLRFVKQLGIRLINRGKEIKLYEKISHLWAPTGESRDHWKENTNCSITLTSGGYDSNIWKPGDKIGARKYLELPVDIPVILSSSVIIPKKRLHELIKAVSLVKKEVGDLRLIINGYGEVSEKKKLKNLVGQLNLNKYVVFTDYVSESDLVQYYQAADVFVHLSAVEGGPASCKQALATNTPVVMTLVGSVGKWIRESGMGRLFPVGDIAACAKKIIKTLKSEERPVTIDFAYELWSWDARGKMMATDIEEKWRKAMKT
jgi:glycosyltransferase involved in cell wall biosynthesis